MSLTYSQRERRKTKKRKAAETDIANRMAAAEAHVAQVNRHVEKVQVENNILTQNAETLAADLAHSMATTKTQAADIALFKQEALQSAIREAELRGYIQRTLEDDAAREPKPVDQQDCIVQTTFQPRNEPARRTGPLALTGSPWDSFVWNSSREADSASNYARYGSHSAQSVSQQPKHWLAR